MLKQKEGNFNHNSLQNIQVEDLLNKKNDY
jgi:hypothetical protein